MCYDENEMSNTAVETLVYKCNYEEHLIFSTKKRMTWEYL